MIGHNTPCTSGLCKKTRQFQDIGKITIFTRHHRLYDAHRNFKFYYCQIAIEVGIRLYI